MTEAQHSDNTDEPRLYQFIGLVFLWLVPCFVIWVSLSSLIALPAVWLTDLVLTFSLPDIVHEITLAGPQSLLATNFGDLDGKIVSAQLAGYRMAYPLDTRILSYSIPFYAALHFATQTTSGVSGKEDGYGRFGRGLLLLYLLLIVGMISVNLKNLMLGLGPEFIDSSSIWASVIGMMYQFNTLMVPALAPIMLWAWQSRESSLLQQFLLKIKQ